MAPPAKLAFNRSLYYYTTSTHFFLLLSLRVMQSLSGFPDHIHTVIYLHCTKAAGVKSLLQGHLSGGNEGGASAVFHLSCQFYQFLQFQQCAFQHSRSAFSRFNYCWLWLFHGFAWDRKHDKRGWGQHAVKGQNIQTLGSSSEDTASSGRPKMMPAFRQIVSVSERFISMVKKKTNITAHVKMPFTYNSV